MDCSLDNVREDISELVTRVGDMEKQHAERQHSVCLKDIQDKLVNFYKRRCGTLPVSPVLTNKDENLLDIYKYPNMHSIKRTRVQSDQKKEITSYEGIFCKDRQFCEEIYLTGDAGVGKTAFCTCMSLLWCYAKSGAQLDFGYALLHKDVEYVSKFDFLFHISLRETCHTRVVDMIIEQLFENNKDMYQSIIENIVTEKSSLILMDGLDEWMPSQLASNRTYELPGRIYSSKCVYITTSRPHRLESVRLASKDIDHHVEILGISKVTSESYVKHVIRYLNGTYSGDKSVDEFIRDMGECELDDLLCIPIIASHLVVLWFEGTIRNMPRALIYANILEMLFKRAETTGVSIPSFTESKFQHIPASFSGLEYINKHHSLLYNICHLSFGSLFKSNEDVPNLVFTVGQLEDEPYCFTVKEIDFLCKIGILSKHEVFGCYSEEKLKLSFIHNSYLEFFAALYISTTDTLDFFDDRWKSIYYVVQSENLILLLVGMSTDGGKQLFDTLYQLLADELSLCRTNAVLHDDDDKRDSYLAKISSLQDLGIRCYRELDRFSHPNTVLRLEDYIFDISDDTFRVYKRSYDDDRMVQNLVLNAPNVKSLHSLDGHYYVEFDHIINLQYLHIGDCMDDDTVYDVKFSELMIQNNSTLHTVCIEGRYPLMSLPELPVRSLHHLTSLSLCYVQIKHDCLLDLLAYLSDNVLMENIKLKCVVCDDHEDSIDCGVTLSLPHHTKLVSLYLHEMNVVCKSINTPNLKSITIYMIDIDILNSIQHSKLEHLGIDMYDMSDNTNTGRILTAVLKTLPCLKSMILSSGIKLSQDSLLELHPEATTVNIELRGVKISPQWFHCFVQSCASKNCVKQVKLHRCRMVSDDGEPHMSVQESVIYIANYLTSRQTVNITQKEKNVLSFETRCQ